MVSGLWMWAVSDIKLVTSVECGVGYCMRFALIFVKIWEIVSCVEIPDTPIAARKHWLPLPDAPDRA